MRAEKAVVTRRQGRSLRARALPLLTAALAMLPGFTTGTLAAQTASDTTTITIRSTSSALAFEPDLISARSGTLVRIRYHNESVFAHNIIVLRSEDDIDVVGAASFHAGETGFVPLQHKDKMVAYSPLAAAGSTVEFTFRMPAPGEYPFVCFVDGHFNMMIGKLRSH